jgi:phospholipase/lecithinase/hemolysin
MTFPRSLRLFACFALLSPLLSLHATTNSPYDAIYVFGDSYCDVGNIYLATSGATPLSPPYYHGRFSNGPIWVEHVASAWGLPMTPSLAGGTDYAVGGAEVTTSVSEPQGASIPSVPEQVVEYLQAHGGKADPHALYILEGGGNDILNATGGSPAVLGLKIAAGLAGSELLLRQAGAKNFLIPDLLDVALLPAGQANASFASAASIATNQSLDKLLQLEELLQGINIFRLPVFALFQSIAADATHFGFTNITQPCLNPTTDAVCADPDHTLFWDEEHPTEFGHSFFAVLVVSRLSK